MLFTLWSALLQHKPEILFAQMRLDGDTTSAIFSLLPNIFTQVGLLWVLSTFFSVPCLLLLILVLTASCRTWERDDASCLLTLDPDLCLNLRVLLHRWDDSWRRTMGDSGCCCVSIWCFNLWSPFVVLCWCLVYNFFDPAINLVMSAILLVYGL